MLQFHLCDLDAPFVAVIWQFLFAQSFGIRPDLAAVVALATTAWLIYAGDRLLDVAREGSSLHTRRHAFHRQHYKRILGVAIPVVAGLGAACSVLRPSVLRGGLLLSAMVAGYLLGVHMLPATARRWFPKEILVGTLFAAGVCLGPSCRIAHPLQLLVPGLLFAALCCLNCAAIEIWEWQRYHVMQASPPFATLWLARYLRQFLWHIAGGALLFCFLPGPRALFLALFLSAVMFLWVDAKREGWPVDVLRMVADMPLTSPLLVLTALSVSGLLAHEL